MQAPEFPTFVPSGQLPTPEHENVVPAKPEKSDGGLLGSQVLENLEAKL